MPSLLGVDSGLTVTKAVIFDESGRPLSVARRRVPQSLPAPRRVERDMEGLWTAAAQAIRSAIEGSGRPASEIIAVAPTAHGDGVYLLDGDRNPLGPGILSLDSRAAGVVENWETSGAAAEALALTGQMPHASAPSALLAWIAHEEPERFARIAHVFACKDWLRFRLTGELGTDRTEASASFTAVHTQDWSDEALRLYGLARLRAALPAIGQPGATAGRITARAAAESGLLEGTPVAFGLHDVTASALGIGAHVPGVVGVVAGTYSINEVVTDRPRADPRWFCRSAVEPGRWNAMSISPASTANYDWFLDTLCGAERADAEASGLSIHAELAPEIEAALARPSTAIFHPFLFGSPHGAAASGGFFGLHGWHDRGDMLRAVLEGIAFNHRTHVEALREGFAPREIRLTGGASRNPSFAQLFADVAGLPVTVTDTEEAAAWGAALCAGVAAGMWARADDDPRDLGAISTLYRLDATRALEYNRRFAVYRELVEALAPLWPEIERLEGTRR